jgi:hypothetical protein
LFAITATAKPPTPFEQIQQLSAEFNHANKPLSMDETTKFYEEGIKILHSDAFDNEYQAVRAEGFDNNNWTEADKMTKLSSPLFTVTFDGDYDVYQINGTVLFNATQQDIRKIKKQCKNEIYCNLTSHVDTPES